MTASFPIKKHKTRLQSGMAQSHGFTFVPLNSFKTSNPLHHLYLTPAHPLEVISPIPPKYPSDSTLPQPCKTSCCSGCIPQTSPHTRLVWNLSQLCCSQQYFMNIPKAEKVNALLQIEFVTAFALSYCFTTTAQCPFPPPASIKET